jgi:hypothetical protein
MPLTRRGLVIFRHPQTTGCSQGMAKKAVTWARIEARAATTEAWSVGSTACVQAWWLEPWPSHHTHARTDVRSRHTEEKEEE